MGNVNPDDDGDGNEEDADDDGGEECNEGGAGESSVATDAVAGDVLSTTRNGVDGEDIEGDASANRGDCKVDFESDGDDNATTLAHGDADNGAPFLVLVRPAACAR